MHSVLSKQPDEFIESSFRNITSKLERQYEQALSNSGSEQKFISDIDHHWNRGRREMEAENAANSSIEKGPKPGKHVLLSLMKFNIQLFFLL